jgi:hypothetical protein
LKLLEELPGASRSATERRRSLRASLGCQMVKRRNEGQGLGPRG